MVLLAVSVESNQAITNWFWSWFYYAMGRHVVDAGLALATLTTIHIFVTRTVIIFIL